MIQFFKITEKIVWTIAINYRAFVFYLTMGTLAIGCAIPAIMNCSELHPVSRRSGSVYQKSLFYDVDLTFFDVDLSFHVVDLTFYVVDLTLPPASGPPGTEQSATLNGSFPNIPRTKKKG